MSRAIVFSITLILVGFSPSYASDSRCTKTGTEGPNAINGTPQHDVLCARGGKDYVNGRASADVVRGGADADTVVGGDGVDFLYGRVGADQLFAADGTPGDFLDGGPGFDKCYGDRGDHFRRCEHKAVV